MKVILDVDTGVDDAVALVLALNSPEIEVLALTTVAGNAPVAECTRNTLLVSELARPANPPPVAEGAPAPLAKKLLTAPEVHGADGLGDQAGTLPAPARRALPVPAHRLLTELARRHPGEITLIATGPLTNAALALRADPDGMAMFRRVVCMGGAFRVPGNTGPVAEFNWYVDPEAADGVMRSGLDVTLIPLDATTRSPLARGTVESVLGPLEADGAPPAGSAGGLAGIMRGALACYMRYQRSESGLEGGYMHDPLAVASVIAPDIVKLSAARVRVTLDGPDRGRSVIARAPGDALVAVALDLDARRFQTLLRRRCLDPLVA